MGTPGPRGPRQLLPGPRSSACSGLARSTGVAGSAPASFPRRPSSSWRPRLPDASWRWAPGLRPLPAALGPSLRGAPSGRRPPRGVPGGGRGSVPGRLFLLRPGLRSRLLGHVSPRLAKRVTRGVSWGVWGTLAPALWRRRACPRRGRPWVAGGWASPWETGPRSPAWRCGPSAAVPRDGRAPALLQLVAAPSALLLLKWAAERPWGV